MNKIIRIIGMFAIMSFLLLPAAAGAESLVPAHYNINIFTSYNTNNAVTVIKLTPEEIAFFGNNTNYLDLQYLNSSYVTYYYSAPYLVIYANITDFQSNIQLFKLFNDYQGKNDSGIMNAWGHASVAVWQWPHYVTPANLTPAFTENYFSAYQIPTFFPEKNIPYKNISAANINQYNNSLSLGVYFEVRNDTKFLFSAYDSFSTQGITILEHNDSSINQLFDSTYSSKNVYISLHNSQLFLNGAHFPITTPSFNFTSNITHVTFQENNTRLLLSFDNYSLQPYAIQTINQLQYIPAQYVLDNQQFVFLMIIFVIIFMLAFFAKNITVDFLLMFMVATYWYYSFVSQSVMLVLLAMTIYIAGRDITQFFRRGRNGGD